MVSHELPERAILNKSTEKSGDTKSTCRSRARQYSGAAPKRQVLQDPVAENGKNRAARCAQVRLLEKKKALHGHPIN